VKFTSVLARVNPRTENRKVTPARTRAGSLAAAAILVVALIGFRSYINPPGGYEALNAPGPAPTASPVTGCLVDQDQGVPSLSALPITGINDLRLGTFSSDALYADNVQLQGWTLNALATATIPGNTSEGFAGVAVDFVLQGYYSATFGGPAIVSQGNLTGAPGGGFSDSGGTVELSHGDAIAFAYGAGITVHNVSSTTPLVFKRVLLTKGSAAASMPTGDGFQIALDQQTALPRPIGGMVGGSQMAIWLEYQHVDVPAKSPRQFCTETTAYRLVSTIDPTRPANADQNGYVLYISTSGRG
jgi:hypothetical protein